MTPVRMLSPSISVVWPTRIAVDVRDRVRRAGWETADLDSEVAGAWHVPDDSSPWHVRCPAHGDDGVTHGSWRPRDRDRGRRLLEPDAPRSSTRTRSSGTRAGSPRAARSPSTPASTRAARRRTSSSSASRAPRTGSGGATSTRRSRRSTSTGCARRSSRTSATATSTSSMRSRAPTRSSGSPSASSRTIPTTRSSRGRCSSTRPTTSSRDFEPQALVLHAPALEAEPEADGTRTGTFVVLHPSRRRC